MWAASTAGFLVRKFRVVWRISALAKPASLNSCRKVTPSLAPAIQLNQLLAADEPGGSVRINSET